MLFDLVVLITLAAAALVGYTLRRVPEGPACPRCGRLVRAARTAPRPGALRPMQRLTVDALCPACGWAGRMRRGLQLEAVRERRGRGGAR